MNETPFLFLMQIPYPPQSRTLGPGTSPHHSAIEVTPQKNCILVMKSKNKSLFFGLTKENVSIYKLERCSSSKDFDMQSLKNKRLIPHYKVPPYIFATQTSPKLIWGNCTAFNLHYSGVIRASKIDMVCAFAQFPHTMRNEQLS